MRIGIDASNLRAGGGVTHISELLHAANPAEHGIDQVTVWGGEQTLKRLPLSESWLNLVHEPLLDRSLPLRLYWQREKLSKLAEQACDLLFVPGGLYLGSFKPMVTMSQNMLPFEAHEMGRYGLSAMFTRMALLRVGQTRSFQNADGIVFLTEYARSTILNQIKTFKGKTRIISHGIDNRFCQEPRVQLPISNYSFATPFRLTYVSTVDVYKHQWYVAEAVANLRKEGIPLSLDLIGSAYPPALRRLQAVTKQIDPTGDFIHYHGLVPYEKLDAFYRQADGLVYASSCENMPIILMEMMASGLAIACSRRGPMPEVLGNAGVYFDPESPVDIANALRVLVQKPKLREQCAVSAFERAQVYSWKRCARETFSFLNYVGQHSVIN